MYDRRPEWKLFFEKILQNRLGIQERRQLPPGDHAGTRQAYVIM
jgi:hypothetical protein